MPAVRPAETPDALTRRESRRHPEGHDETSGANLANILNITKLSSRKSPEYRNFSLKNFPRIYSRVFSEVALSSRLRHEPLGP